MLNVSTLATWRAARQSPSIPKPLIKSPQKPKQRVNALPKGYCPKCRKHIGSGLYAHKKACKK